MPLGFSKRHIFMIMDLATGGELFNLVTKNPGDCATESEIKRMLTNMLSAVRCEVILLAPASLDGTRVTR